MKLRQTLLILAIGLLACFQLGASCESSGGSNGGGGYGGGGYGDGGYGYPDYDRPNRIPRWSDLVREGQGKLKWTADLDGDIYIYDIDKDFIPYTGPIRRGQEVVVQPDSDRIFVNAKVVYSDNLRRDGVYQIYFAVTRGSRPGNPIGSNVIPPKSQRMARGNDYIEMDSAPRNGTVYLYDEADRIVIFSTKVRRDAAMQVYRRDSYIMIDGKRYRDVKFVRGHTLTIYFKAD